LLRIRQFLADEQQVQNHFYVFFSGFCGLKRIYKTTSNDKLRVRSWKLTLGTKRYFFLFLPPLSKEAKLMMVSQQFPDIS
jgi:hypothetical protein